jgi:hypothetical protein
MLGSNAVTQLFCSFRVCKPFNGKPQATVFYCLTDAYGLPLNDETSASVLIGKGYAPAQASKPRAAANCTSRGWSSPESD